VSGWGGIFSPGAPGFPYVFRMPNKPQVRLPSKCVNDLYPFLQFKLSHLHLKTF
jgi:hypothetical protein